MDNYNETTTLSDEQEKLAYYRLISDAYKQKFKLHSVVFHMLLKHMLKKMHDETTIYYVMQELNCLHNSNKQDKEP